MEMNSSNHLNSKGRPPSNLEKANLHAPRGSTSAAMCVCVAAVAGKRIDFLVHRVVRRVCGSFFSRFNGKLLKPENCDAGWSESVENAVLQAEKCRYLIRSGEGSRVQHTGFQRLEISSARNLPGFADMLFPKGMRSFKTWSCPGYYTRAHNPLQTPLAGRLFKGSGVLKKRPFSDVTIKNPTVCEQSSQASKGAKIPRLTWREIRRIFFCAAIPMFGFGIVDQLIMIRAGDFIDNSIGVKFGLATLSAAAVGQLCSDTCGVLFGNTIDSIAQNLGAKPPNILAAQRSLVSFRLATSLGAAFGVIVGCIVGMTQLLFIDIDRAERLKKQKELDTIFEMVMSDGPKLFNCQRGTLFVYDKSKEEIWSKAVFGLEQAIRMKKNKSRSFTTWVFSNKEILNCPDAYQDDRFNPFYDQKYKYKTRSVLAAPVVDSDGEVMAVLMFINKHEDCGGLFTQDDERMIEMMCKHIQIFMEKYHYGAAEDKRMISIQEDKELKSYHDSCEAEAIAQSAQNKRNVSHASAHTHTPPTREGSSRNCALGSSGQYPRESSNESGGAARLGPGADEVVGSRRGQPNFYPQPIRRGGGKALFGEGEIRDHPLNEKSFLTENLVLSEESQRGNSAEASHPSPPLQKADTSRRSFFDGWFFSNHKDSPSKDFTFSSSHTHKQMKKEVDLPTNLRHLLTNHQKADSSPNDEDENTGILLHTICAKTDACSKERTRAHLFSNDARDAFAVGRIFTHASNDEGGEHTNGMFEFLRSDSSDGSEKDFHPADEEGSYHEDFNADLTRSNRGDPLYLSSQQQMKEADETVYSQRFLAFPSVHQRNHLPSNLLVLSPGDAENAYKDDKTWYSNSSNSYAHNESSGEKEIGKEAMEGDGKERIVEGEESRIISESDASLSSGGAAAYHPPYWNPQYPHLYDHQHHLTGMIVEVNRGDT